MWSWDDDDTECSPVVLGAWMDRRSSYTLADCAAILAALLLAALVWM